MPSGTRVVKRLRSGILLALVVAVVSFLWRILSAPGGRLLELSAREHPIACRNAMLVTLGEQSNQLQGRPVMGGESRVLTPPFGSPGRLRAIFGTDQGAIVRCVESASPTAQAWTAVGPHAFTPGPQRARLWEVTLDGKPARELLPELQMHQAVPAGDLCFWVQAGSVPSLRDKKQPQKSGFARGTGNLYVTPLRGGPSRRIATGFSLLSPLVPLQLGVSWSVFHANPQRVDRFLALPPDFQVHGIPDCAGDPELLGERLYWFDWRPRPVSGGPAETELKLMSAGVDGDERREVLDLTRHSYWEAKGQLLGVHQEKLYALLYRRSARSGSPQRPTLCELRGDTVREVATLRPETGAMWLDGSYLYYSATERRENWLDWTSTGLARKRVELLYRVLLPG